MSDEKQVRSAELSAVFSLFSSAGKQFSGETKSTESVGLLGNVAKEELFDGLGRESENTSKNAPGLEIRCFSNMPSTMKGLPRLGCGMFALQCKKAS